MRVQRGMTKSIRRSQENIEENVYLRKRREDGDLPEWSEEDLLSESAGISRRRSIERSPHQRGRNAKYPI